MQSTIHNMMQDNTFQEDLSFHPSATSFTELAIRYNPRMSVRGARRVLHAWIRHNSDLTQALKRLSWTSTDRQLTPLQVKAIYLYLGEP